MRFNVEDRPEDIVQQFFTYLETRDKDLAKLLQSQLADGRELTSQRRAEIARKAIQIIRRRGENNG